MWGGGLCIFIITCVLAQVKEECKVPFWENIGIDIELWPIFYIFDAQFRDIHVFHEFVQMNCR